MLWAEGNMATAVDLPEPGKPARVLFVSALYRLERLTPAQAAAYPPLRDDRKFWAARIAELREELIETEMHRLREDPRSLEVAALLFEDDRLLNLARTRLREWLGPMAEPGEKRWQWLQSIITIMEKTGLPDDLALLEEVCHRHPKALDRLSYSLPRFARRVGLRHGRRLLLRLLDSTETGDVRLIEPLLPHAPSTPKPQRRDYLLADVADVFDLDPKKFGMARTFEHYLQLKNPHPSAADAESARREFGDVWIFPTEEARTRGLDHMRRWLNEVGRD